ncbi:MAG: outer membrane beta-barrel protein [Rhodocyclales bacterium]|nr:outer membrane beta-barrel protein [Rhodocyclales bacterium]
MIKRDRLALFFGATMTLGALATGDAVAAENSTADGISQEIGISASSYKYVEDNFMSLKGPLLGIDYGVRFAVSDGGFVKGDVRYSRGKVDYESEGTGTADNNTTWYLETRLLAGYDFALGSHTLGPYTGLGFRYLYHDGRGTTSTGAIGYRRESRYTYLPLGLAHRWTFSEHMKLTTTIEYDYLLEGRQTSELNDGAGQVTTPTGTVVSAQPLKNDQSHGHGWRASVMLQFGNWKMGPYANYWRLSTSEPDDAYLVDNTGNVWILTGVEPKNKTTEAGFKAHYLF